MVSLLLPVIYLAFISLGLPDSLLGSAWPSMYEGLGASVSWAGILSMIIAGGTILSSLASDRMNTRFGTGKVTLVSVFLTAVSLFGFSASHTFWALCLWAVPYGLGAGSVDAALNNYVALHYKACHMSWLHCMWGVGASVGPVIMGYAIKTTSWNRGYFIISVLQILLTAVLLVSLPLWKKQETAETAAGAGGSRSFSSILRLAGVKEVLLCFFCYCALEACAGMWAASYCTLYRGIPAVQAAAWGSLFYLGITAGRFVSGFVSLKVTEQNMIRLGQAVIAAGILLVLIPAGNAALLLGLLLIGCGCAPVYPSIIHETPANFGPEMSQAIIGLQMASAYTGSCLMPPLFGLLAENISFVLYPVFLALILLLMFLMAEKLHRSTESRRREYRAANGR